MNHLNVFLATLALTCLALFPAVVRADDVLDDLDVTMMVLDDDTDLEGTIAKMRGPEVEESNDDADHDGDHGGDQFDDGIDNSGHVEDGLDGGHSEDRSGHGGGHSDDGFADDDDFEEDDDLTDEDDFEDDERADDDHGGPGPG